MPEQTTLGALSPQRLTQKKDWRQPCGLHNNLSRKSKDMYIRSYTFCEPLWHFCEEVIRSYTFRATLPQLCVEAIRSYTFRATLPLNY